MSGGSNGQPALTRADAEEFTEALGQVVAGGWRLSLQAWRLGVPQALEMSHDEWVTEKLGGYVSLNAPERREVVAELTEEGMSTREIGDVLGVGNATVHRDREAVSNETEEPVDVAPEPLAVKEAVSNETDEPTRTKGQLSNQSGGTDEWETPQDFFDALNAEFNFDLDVCALPSSAKCERYFSPEDDGLAQEWNGTCWMNPPYGDAIVRWVEKASESAKAGATVVGLVPARPGSRWFYEHCSTTEVRFIVGRLKFGENATSAPFDSAVVVFGRPASVVWWER